MSKSKAKKTEANIETVEETETNIEAPEDIASEEYISGEEHIAEIVESFDSDCVDENNAGAFLRYRATASILYNDIKINPGEILPIDMEQSSLNSLIKNGFVELA